MNGTTSRSFWAAGIGSAVIALPVPTMVGAQTRLYSFSIPAGPVDDALRRYARITGRQLLYRPEAVRGRQSRTIAGQLTADDALAQILRDTGLADRRPAANVVVIEPSPPAAQSSLGQASVVDTEPHQDVVVTGSNIRGVAGQIAPVRTITRADLERSGQASFADAIAALPQNFGGSGNPVASLTGADQSSLNNTVAPAANLRGLGTDATLTLFNGRRVAGSGGRGDFTDLSAIPSLAVDRVEILTDGASAIYGSDAVGGVVNLILRERQNGVEARIRGTTATDGSFRNGLAGFSAGHTWSSGAVFLAYEFEHRDELLASARSYTATGDLRPFGGTDHRTYLSVPGTLLGFDPASGNLVPLYAVPSLPAGVQPTAAQFLPGQNLSNPLAGTALSPEFSRHAVYAHVDQALSSSLDVFLEGRFARRTFAYAGPASSAIFLITPANPYFVSVAGAPYSIEGYSFANDLGATRLDGGVTSFSATGGLTYRPGSNWTIDAYVSFSRERSHDRQSNIANTTALDEALGNPPDDPATAFSTAANGFFNPYGSGSANSRAILTFVGDGYAALSRSSSVGQGSIKADGPLFGLPGGTVKAAIGADYRRETFARGGSLLYYGDAPLPASSGDNARDVKAVFAEIDVPIVGAANASTMLRSLILSAAIRHERYSDFGSTTNPKVGAAWRPAAGVLLRGSWGTSFRAPALPELNDRLAVGPTQVQNAAGVYVPVLYLSGGNPALGPEKATSFTGGVVLEPTPIPGLRFETSFFSTRFRDQIGQPVLQDIQHALTNPALAPYVQLISPATNAGDLAQVDALLATPGAMSTAGVPPTAFQAIIDARYVNTSSLLVSGLDQEIHLTRPIGRDRIDVDFVATWLFTYTSRPTPLSPEQRRLDTVGNPASLRFRSSATWEHGALTATAITNFVDGYVDKSMLPYRAVSAFFTIDANIGFAPKRGFLRTSRFAFSVLNLLDRSPPFVDAATGLGFDAANANPFGRTVSLEFATKF